MLAQAVQSYLDTRRACGFKLANQGDLLLSFANFSAARRKFHVSADVAIEWAGLTHSTSQRAHRLAVVIRFARYARATDRHHELPEPVFGKERWARPVPYIFSKDEIHNLVQAAGQVGAPTLRCETYSTLFALLACTGLRVSEAIGLRYEDITSDGLVLRCTKFRKSRLVPLHDSARTALERYLERRRPYAPLDDHVFISLRRKPLIYGDVLVAFRTAADKIQLPRGPGVPRATPHSLRHTFAVRALESCPDGRDRITKHMLALSTYLGHVNVAATYWYLQATSELMTDIAERCERFMGDPS